MSPSEYKVQFTKKKDWRRVGQAPIWNRSMICRILDDERYIGNMVSGQTKVKYVGGGTRRTKPEEYIIVENTHEPIIDRELFFRVRPKKLAEPRSGKRDKLLLAGLLRCPGCDRIFEKYGTYPHAMKYRCYSVWVGVENENCCHETFKEQELNEIVIQAVESELTRTAELKQIRKGMADKEKAYGKRINAINKQIKGLKQQKIDGYIKLTKNELSEEDFFNLKQKIESSIEECERELDSCKVNDLSAADEVTINLFEEFLGAENFTNEMLRCLIKTIYVYDDRRIEIKWNFKEKVL